MKERFRKVYSVSRKLIWGIRNIPAAIVNAKRETYYPELQRKRKVVRIWENLCWLFKYREVNDFYNLYGLDIENSNLKAYQDYYGFMTSRNVINKAGKLDSQQVLLRNKFLFYKIMQSYNAPVPEVFALIRAGKIYDTQLSQHKSQNNA